jgi:hypothetical protein
MRLRAGGEGKRRGRSEISLKYIVMSCFLIQGFSPAKRNRFLFLNVFNYELSLLH